MYTKRWFSYIPVHTPRGQCVICAVVYINVHTYVVYTYMFCAVLSCFSCAQLFATLWTVAHQAPPSTGCSRQEYWSGFPCPPPRDLSDPGIKSMPPVTPASQADSLLLSHWGNPPPPHTHVRGMSGSWHHYSSVSRSVASDPTGCSFVTSWTVALQAPLSMASLWASLFPKQYSSGKLLVL